MVKRILLGSVMVGAVLVGLWSAFMAGAGAWILLSDVLEYTEAAADGDVKDAVEVGFGEADITPAIGKEPVYLAGFGQNRKATKVHDPLFARAVVLRQGKRKIALASVDLVGFFRVNVVNVRKKLPGFD